MMKSDRDSKLDQGNLAKGSMISYSMISYGP